MPTPRSRHLLALTAFALAGALLAGLPHAPRPVSGPDKGDHYPSDWFFAQRAFPSGTIDQDAFLAAVGQARAARARLSTSSGVVWQSAGPYNIGGRVTALAVVPGGATIYLGSANGGVFRSNDSGVNWTSILDGELTFSIGALALDPTDPDIVYCGTGEANSAVDTYDGSGLYRTSDGGASWEHLGLEATRRIGRIAIDPSNPDRIFVAAMGTQFSTNPDRGLYRSEDGGANWTKVLFMNDSTGVADVVINPAHPETVYCATWERVRHPTYRRAFGPGCGIWRSTNSGTTWTRLQNGLPTPTDSVGRIGLAIAPSRPSTVYAQIITGSIGGYNGRGMYRTQDGGATWTRRDVSGFTGLFGGFGWYFGDMAVDPTNPDRVYALGQGLGYSTNGGSNFADVTGDSHVDHHAMWIDPTNPNRVYLGNDGGFYSTTVGGSTWFKAVTLDITQFYAGAIDPSNPARLMGGTQDNNTLLTNGSPTGWFPILGGDGFHCSFDPTNPAVLLAEWQYSCSNTGPRRSTNSGGAWTQPTGIIPSDRFNWSTPLVMNPKNHNVVLVGSQRVYRSTNNGISYATLSGDLTTSTPSLLLYGTITTLDISPADTSVYYAGTDDGKVWRSTNRGGAWTDISAGLPLRWVTRVTADPVDPQVVYVTHSGFGGDEHVPHIHRSANQGTSWTPIDGDLPDVPLNDVVVDPDDPQHLFVATDVGVYWTPNQGTLWVPLGSGLPFTAVFDLTLHAPSRTLVAATHGRSQWKADLSQITLAAGPPAGGAPGVALSAPAPNPSRGRARLTLELSAPGRAEVAVFDAGGRRVRTLVSARLEAGRHPIAWDGVDATGAGAPAGVYFVRASTPDGVARQRLVRVE